MFLDADDFHPEANLKKCHLALHLTIRTDSVGNFTRGTAVKSGLRPRMFHTEQNYRSMLEDTDRNTVFIMLDISKETADVGYAQELITHA